MHELKITYIHDNFFLYDFLLYPPGYQVKLVGSSTVKEINVFLYYCFGKHTSIQI